MSSSCMGCSRSFQWLWFVANRAFQCLTAHTRGHAIRSRLSRLAMPQQNGNERTGHRSNSSFRPAASQSSTPRAAKNPPTILASYDKLETSLEFSPSRAKTKTEAFLQTLNSPRLSPQNPKHNKPTTPEPENLLIELPSRTKPLEPKALFLALPIPSQYVLPQNPALLKWAPAHSPHAPPQTPVSILFSSSFSKILHPHIMPMDPDINLYLRKEAYAKPKP